MTLRRLGKEWPDIGLKLSTDDDPTYLTVDEVRDPSLVADWNSCHGVLERVMVFCSLPWMHLLVVFYAEIQHDGAPRQIESSWWKRCPTH